MHEIHKQFTRFSAFYSPLISTMSGGFLEQEGLQPSHTVAPAGRSAIDSLLDGSAHVVQSAPSQGLSSLEKGQAPSAVHFAQINEKAFREGRGDYIHQQGPAPQQLEHDGVGYVVASVGEVIGPCGFSSLAATREWLDSEMATAFMRAYRRTRKYINETPAKEIAEAEADFFPETPKQVLTKTIAAYQKLGCWTPHVEITKAAYEVTLDVFEHVGRLKTRHPYEAVCASPPGV